MYFLTFCALVLIALLNLLCFRLRLPSKFADMTPLYKKGITDAKQNYRPVTILPNLSKIYERSMFKQMSSFFEDIFFKHQCCFRKGFSTQQCLLTSLEKWPN